MPIIRIEDPEDSRIEAYRDIRERDLVGRRGLFVAEGKVVLAMLLKSRGHTAESALVLEGRLEGLRDVLALAPGLTVYVAARDVMDRIAGFPIHRGILAIGRRVAAPEPAALLAGLPRNALILALAGIANHDNIGALFRNTAAFGADAVLMDGTCCDPLYRKAIRVSVGATLRVPYATVASAAALADLLEAAGFSQYALSPTGTVSIRELERRPRMALWLGQEGHGLPEPIMRRMTTVRIPIVPDFDSLNVAAASAVALSVLAPDPASATKRSGGSAG